MTTYLLLVKNLAYSTKITNRHFEKIINIFININVHYTRFYCRPKRGKFAQLFFIKLVLAVGEIFQI